MKKVCIALILTIFVAKANAQNGSYSFWYEYGNGNFISKSFQSASDLSDYVVNGLPVTQSGSNNNAVMKVTPIYRPGGKIFMPYFSVRPSINETSTSFATTPLPADKNLFVHSSTRDFISDDTVMVALNYKSIDVNNRKLAFFYNSNVNNTFVPISTISATINMQVFNAVNTLPIPQIRMFNNEKPSVATAAIMRGAGNGFKNGLVFDIASITDPEKNIFITMRTLTDIVLTQNENFKLVFLDGDNNPLQSQNNELLNHSALKSHDPNYEKVIPACLEIPDGGSTTLLSYQVHFQNTGEGPALKVVTTTTLPKGYSINDIQQLNNLDWEIAKQKKNDGYTIDVTGSHDNQLIIRFTKKPQTNIILKGTLGMDDPLNDVTTMGDFSFDLKLKKPLTREEDLASSTSIVFDNNEEVITNDAIVRIRKCCTCKEKEKNNNGNTNNASNNKPCKSKRKVIQWLLCKDC